MTEKQIKKGDKFKRFLAAGVMFGVLLCGAKSVETPSEKTNIRSTISSVFKDTQSVLKSFFEKDFFVFDKVAEDNQPFSPKYDDISTFIALDTITRVAMHYKKNADVQNLLVEMGYLGSKELNHGYTKEDLFYAKEFLKQVKNKEMVIYDAHPISEIIAYSLTAGKVDPEGAKAADAFLVKVGTFGKKFKETMNFDDAKKATRLLSKKGFLHGVIDDDELKKVFGNDVLSENKSILSPISSLFHQKER